MLQLDMGAICMAVPFLLLLQWPGKPPHKLGATSSPAAFSIWKAQFRAVRGASSYGWLTRIAAKDGAYWVAIEDSGSGAYANRVEIVLEGRRKTGRTWEPFYSTRVTFSRTTS
ncbi:MAG: hypothetical protein ACHQ50_05875, partial [Fimbriimonadales bacterium]